MTDADPALPGDGDRRTPGDPGGDASHVDVGPVQFAPRGDVGQRRRRRRRRRRCRRVLGFSLLGVGVLTLFSLAWIAVQGYRAYDSLQSAADTLTQVETRIDKPSSIDGDRLNELLDKLADESGTAVSAVHDPLYRLASHLPWAGPNMTAVAAVAETVDDVGSRVLPAAKDVAKVLRSGVAPIDGKFNLTTIIEATGPLEDADRAVTVGRARMAAIDRSAVIGPIDHAVVRLWQNLDRAAELTGTGSRLARLLPGMLGSDGPREYLLVFQNPAELRATGGIFGSYVLVSADDGRITILDQGAASRTIGTFTSPVKDIDPALRALYSDRLVTSPLDVNFTADFPTAARLFASMYAERTGTRVDGVVALDPVSVSYLLSGQRPITLGDGTKLTAKNIVPFLLSTVYAKFPETSDAAERDAYLAHAVRTVFMAVTQGDISPQQMVKGLRRAAVEHRFLVWSSHAVEQPDLVDAGVAGELDATGAGPPTVGVYFNDGTGAKLDYYLRGSVQITPKACHSSGSRSLEVRVHMDYPAPRSGLPDYVLGLALGGKPYVLRTNVVIVAPAGGTVLSVTNDGSAIPTVSGIDHGLRTSMVTVDLSPGESTNVQAIVTAPTAPGQAGSTVTPHARVTPGVHTWSASTHPYSACRVNN